MFVFAYAQVPKRPLYYVNLSSQTSRCASEWKLAPGDIKVENQLTKEKTKSREGYIVVIHSTVSIKALSCWMK